MRGDDLITNMDKFGKNYCQPTQNSRNVQLIYDYVGKKWKLPKDDEKGRSSALFHPLLNIKLLNTIFKSYISKGIGNKYETEKA